MIFRRGRRTTGRRAVTGRGMHSVTQYTAWKGFNEERKSHKLDSCHRQDNKGTVSLGGSDVEDERTESEGGEEGGPGPPEPEDHQHLDLLLEQRHWSGREGNLFRMLERRDSHSQ